jgi:hypothetical protein
VEYLGLEPTHRTSYNQHPAPEGGHNHVEHLGLKPTHRTSHNQHPEEATAMSNTWG